MTDYDDEFLDGAEMSARDYARIEVELKRLNTPRELFADLLAAAVERSAQPAALLELHDDTDDGDLADDENDYYDDAESGDDDFTNRSY